MYFIQTIVNGPLMLLKRIASRSHQQDLGTPELNVAPATAVRGCSAGHETSRTWGWHPEGRLAGFSTVDHSAENGELSLGGHGCPVREPFEEIRIIDG
jgi:hypothetical protein